jgi:putative transposase
LTDSGVDASIGTVGDALAESPIGVYKTELIKPRGPWHNREEVDVATAACVYNNRRLHGTCGGRPPVEFETLYELGDLISLVA